MPMAREIRYDKDNAERSLAAAVVAYQQALDLTVEALAAAKGTADLTWFDDIHQETIRAAKGTVTEQIPVEAEADALRFAIEAIDAHFQSLRVRIVKME
jgi:hypothetical protein